MQVGEVLTPSCALCLCGAHRTQPDHPDLGRSEASKAPNLFDHPDLGRSEASKAPNLFEFVRLGCSQATCCGGMRLFRAIIRPDGGKAGR